MARLTIDFSKPGRENSPVLKISDITGAGMCAPGLKAWFDERGIDYRKFKEGFYRICDFEDWDDAYAQIVI